MVLDGRILEVGGGARITKSVRGGGGPDGAINGGATINFDIRGGGRFRDGSKLIIKYELAVQVPSRLLECDLLLDVVKPSGGGGGIPSAAEGAALVESDIKSKLAVRRVDLLFRSTIRWRCRFR